MEESIQPISKRDLPVSEYHSPKKMRNRRRNSSHSVKSTLQIEDSSGFDRSYSSDDGVVMVTEKRLENVDPTEDSDRKDEVLAESHSKDPDEISVGSPRKAKAAQKDMVRSNIPPALPSNIRYTSGSSWNNVGRREKKVNAPSILQGNQHVYGDYEHLLSVLICGKASARWSGLQGER